MNSITISETRSAPIYRSMLGVPPEERGELYRMGLMAPFERKWACYGIPLRAGQPGGYDAVTAAGMLGLLPPEKLTCGDGLTLLENEDFLSHCRNAVDTALRRFPEAGIALPVREYRYAVLLADPEHPSVKMSGGYYGDGGIPGYIMAWLVPSEDTARRLPAALAHEVNHNVRFQFQAWKADITLGDMLVCEGLAENYATSLYGEALAGPWVTRTDAATLCEIKPRIHDALGVCGMDALNAYLYGDELAALQGYPGVGLPYCAGYACGYHLVKHFLRATGTSVLQATVMPTEEILQAAEGFWTQK